MDRLRVLAAQLRDFLQALPPARQASFVALTAAVLAGTIALGWWAQRPRFQVLFTNLEASDAGAVVEHLKAQGIPYRVGAGGATVEVPAGRVHETRLALAASGVPRGGGVGFEIFDKQTLSMTDFVQRLNYQRALQGELARTIADLDAVEAARVHLALPERSLFVAEERRPSASAVLKLRPGRALTPEQVAGVVHLIAASVEGLKPADVTVVDVNGLVLTRALRDGDGRPPGPSMHGFQRELEDRYREQIESMLERVLGPGHALARVTVDLDLAQVEQTEESFDPDRVAVRNERRSRESSAGGAGAAGIPGVAATLTNEPALAPPPEGPTSEREDATLSYEISRVTSRRIEAMGAVRTLSVAVLVDGSYEGEGEARVFVPRPAEEIDRYTELVKRAVGFNEERGDAIEVASVPFRSPAVLETPEAPGWTASLAAWADPLSRAAGLALVLVVALAVVRPFLLAMASRAPVAPRAPVVGSELALPEPAETGGVIELARRNPEQTAQVIRQWLASE